MIMKEAAADDTSQDADSASTSSMGKSTCHILPCNVDFEGMAKTHMFFKPTQVEDGILASCFRGRGLLAMEENDTNEVEQVSHPVLLSLQQSQVEVKASISNFVEWHHESSINAMNYKQSGSNRLQDAKNWIEISKALHDPLPVEG